MVIEKEVFEIHTDIYITVKAVHYKNKGGNGMSIQKIVERIEEQEFTVREYILIGISLFLGGMAAGMLLSPKGKRTIGSNNGNNNIGSIDSHEAECKEKVSGGETE